MAARKNGLAARCLSHRWCGEQLCWSRRCPRVALERSLHRLSMRYDADRRRGGLVAQERKQQTGALVADAIKATAVTESTAAAATDVMDRVAGMIKKAVDRSSGRRFRGEDGQTPAIKTAAADLPLDVLRSMDIRVDRWSVPHCAARTPCGFSRRLRTLQRQLRSRRMRPANAKTSGAHVSRGDVPTYEGLGPCHRIATRARICSTDFYTYACGDSRTAQRSPPRRVG